LLRPGTCIRPDGKRYLSYAIRWTLLRGCIPHRKTSSELQDHIVQTLTGINAWLLTLKKTARGNTTKLTKELANTRRMVQESIQSINRFACELDKPQQA
jgi:hypothetical protein